MSVRVTSPVFAVCLAVSLLALSSGCESQSRESVILQREWFANSEFAGDLLAARFANSQGWELTVAQGSEVIDPVLEVQSGQAHFGVISADRLLRENEQGAQLKAVAVASPHSPVVFLARSGERLDRPEDMKGKFVGIQTGTNTELVFDALLHKNGIDPSAVNEVESGWGIGDFVAKQMDVLAAFDYDEPIQLAEQGIEVVKLYPAKFGVDFLGTVYFARADLVEENPELVRRFVSALVIGWEQAINDRESALSVLLAEYPALDGKKEAASLGALASYVDGDSGQPLFATRQRWEAMAAVLKELERLDEFQFEANVDYSFLRKAQGSEADGAP